MSFKSKFEDDEKHILCKIVFIIFNNICKKSKSTFS